MPEFNLQMMQYCLIRKMLVDYALKVLLQAQSILIGRAIISVIYLRADIGDKTVVESGNLSQSDAF